MRCQTLTQQCAVLTMDQCSLGWAGGLMVGDPVDALSNTATGDNWLGPNDVQCSRGIPAPWGGQGD